MVPGHPEVHELMDQSFIRRVDQEEQSPNCLEDCSASFDTVDRRQGHSSTILGIGKTIPCSAGKFP